MKFSHSKLSTLLTCPMSYYLTYEEGISTIQEKPALYVGSAVHWGIEHNIEDLTEFFDSADSNYTREQLLAEAMVHGYFKHKDELFEKILTNEDGSKLNLIEESHEVYITGKLQSKRWKDVTHDFVGIVDLLLLTNQGFIVIDYKTSTYEPDWSNYLDQIYRYIFLLRCEFPEIPIVKIGIINIKKTAIRQKKTENNEQFLNRMRFEYEINDENYVNYHEYSPSSLDSNLIDEYIDNLRSMCDAGKTIVDDKLWYINFSAANGQYGKSAFWDIFYKTPDAYLLYKISDLLVAHEDFYDDKINDTLVVKSRPCVPIDMLVVDHNNVMNHYSKYKEELTKSGFKDLALFNQHIRENFIFDEHLLQGYTENIQKNL